MVNSWPRIDNGDSFLFVLFGCFQAFPLTSELLGEDQLQANFATFAHLLQAASWGHI